MDNPLLLERNLKELKVYHCRYSVQVSRCKAKIVPTSSKMLETDSGEGSGERRFTKFELARRGHIGFNLGF